MGEGDSPLKRVKDESGMLRLLLTTARLPRDSRYADGPFEKKPKREKKKKKKTALILKKKVSLSLSVYY